MSDNQISARMSKYTKYITPGASFIDQLQKISLNLKPLDDAIEDIISDNFYQIRNIACLLNDKFAKIEYVPGLKTNLYLHQKTIVYAMLELENQRQFTQFTNGFTKEEFQITYNAGVLSEPLGSGKTIDILSVICLSPIPRATPGIQYLELENVSKNSLPIVRYKLPYLLTPTIIFVSISVIKQWQSEIKRFTNLSVLTVLSVIELRTLFDAIENGTINQYDIVLVKNGRITTSVTLPNNIPLENINKVANPLIYSLIANLRQYCWARVVFDDFDHLQLLETVGMVHGLFTWYVSSTIKYIPPAPKSHIMPELASEILQTQCYGTGQISKNLYLLFWLNIRNKDTFIQSVTNVPYPKYHLVLFTNPDDMFMSMLSSLEDNNLNNVIEMLNGNAIETAAADLGIKVHTVSGVFERILGQKYEEYITAGNIIAFIDYSLQNRHAWVPLPKHNHKSYDKRDLLAFKEIKYAYPGIMEFLSHQKEHYLHIYNQTGMAIQRVKDNIKYNKCPICLEEFEQVDTVIILKCCNAIFCSKCAICATHLSKRQNQLNVDNCPKCRTSITIDDFICIGKEIQLDNIIEENFEMDREIELKIKEEEDLKKPLNKFNAIVHLLKNKILPQDERVEIQLPNMLKGSAHLAEPSLRKIIVFANYDETLDKIDNELKSRQITFWRLEGTATQIDNIVHQFEECQTPCILIINSHKHCAGLNLQMATDLVFMHKINDRSIEAQVAGRGQRLGRKSPLNIWYFLYNNEYKDLTKTYAMRKLTQKELEQEIKKVKNNDTVLPFISLAEDNPSDPQEKDETPDTLTENMDDRSQDTLENSTDSSAASLDGE